MPRRKLTYDKAYLFKNIAYANASCTSEELGNRRRGSEIWQLFDTLLLQCLGYSLVLTIRSQYGKQARGKWKRDTVVVVVGIQTEKKRDTLVVVGIRIRYGT